MEVSGAKVDRLVRLYPKVDESETPLPRVWNVKDKYTYIGLSQGNLRVHYKGRQVATVWGGLLCSRSLSLREWEEPQGCGSRSNLSANPGRLWRVLL